MRLHHLALRCPDVARTERFYTEILGFSRVREQPGYSVWLAAGDVMLMLERADPAEPPIPAGSMEMVAFADDGRGEQVRDRLAGAGVPIEAETDWTFYVRDPDGRRVAISRYRFATQPPR